MNIQLYKWFWFMFNFEDVWAIGPFSDFGACVH